MSLSASQIFDAIAPQYASNVNKNTFLELSAGLTSSCYFGDNYNLAIALRAAHMLTLSLRTTGDAGIISSKSEGDSSISYSNNSNASCNSLALTSYGQQLQTLITGFGAGVSVTGDGLGNFC